MLGDGVRDVRRIEALFVFRPCPSSGHSLLACLLSLTGVEIISSLTLIWKWSKTTGCWHEYHTSLALLVLERLLRFCCCRFLMLLMLEIFQQTIRAVADADEFRVCAPSVLAYFTAGTFIS
jgi:hypothetical protein